ncbi:TcaA NTF2-like domain-containing protein [Sporosarcina ureae]|uniref:TcaA protein NTF2-like domain-containing protein n=1 Tax=Sporosarcina ureae TaxID=1571 RepID=A0ABM6JWS5_SPOUR|nr:hypothetical protein [Sporosarcina ureae]ARF14727.1 hypothetical protein SporoS204_11560 [Sporosarcina ureae]
MKCTRCGRHLQPRHEDCPNCGEPIVYKLEKSHNVAKMLFFAVLTIGALVAVVVILYSDHDFTLKKKSVKQATESVLGESTTNPDYDDEWVEEEYELVADDPGMTSESVTVQSDPVIGNTQEYEVDEPLPMRELVEEFYQDYRLMYSESLNNLDFSIVASLLTPNSSAYSEMYKYIDDIKNSGYYFNFYDNEILDYYRDKGMLYLKTYEAFDLIDQNGIVTSHQRNKTYAIVLNYNNVPVQIDAIEITNYYR